MKGVAMLAAEIVIPCFNEANNLEKLISECESVTKLSEYQVGFILINNGSTDGSDRTFLQLVASNNFIKYVSLAYNQGYGGGILAGLELVTAPISGWTHADLQTPLADCLIGVRRIQSGEDFAKGRRTGRSLSDKLFSLGMGLFESTLFGRRLFEINAQPTIFRTEILKKWKNPPPDFSLDLYALVMASKGGVKIARFPVKFLPRQFGKSKWNLGFRSRIKFIRRTLSYSFMLRRALNEDL
jgi:glycosyltransferase involved in cell wall biosynthesis